MGNHQSPILNEKTRLKSSKNATYNDEEEYYELYFVSERAVHILDHKFEPFWKHADAYLSVRVLDAELPDRLHIKVFDPNTADVEMWMPYNSLNPYDLVFSEALSHYATHVKDTKPALWNLLYIRILHL